MADDGTARCLSHLPDDLLRHILFYAPAREGAATAVLARRWRWLWRTSGAVNMDSRSFEHRCSSHRPSSSNREKKRSRSGRYSAEFLSSAEKALAAAIDPIRRLTFFVAEGSKINLTRRRRSDLSLIEALVSNPAARRVEELQIQVEDKNMLDTPYTLSLGSLPSDALRVLRIVNCSRTIFTVTAAPPHAAAAMFPRLADLHLHGCNFRLEDLLTAIAAAPQLSTLHLQSCYFYLQHAKTRDPHKPEFDVLHVSVCYRFLCPTVTAFVFADCRFVYKDCRYQETWLELNLDLPRLQYFRYEGSVELTSRLRLIPHGSNDMIQQVDLRLTSDIHENHPGRQFCELFWQFVQSFNTTRRLKLKLDLLMDDLILGDNAIRDELQGSLSFCRLEQLEIEGKYQTGTTSMVLLTDLLRCCPVVRDFRLKFSKVELPLVPMASSIDNIDDDFLEMLEHLNPSVKIHIG